MSEIKAGDRVRVLCGVYEGRQGVVQSDILLCAQWPVMLDDSSRLHFFLPEYLVVLPVEESAAVESDIISTTFGPLDKIAPERNSDTKVKESGQEGSGYPDDNPKTVMGLAKPPLRSIPPIALLHLGGAMENGAVKYGRFNWRDRHVTSSVYYDAIQRHLLSWWDGEEDASDSGCRHLAHVMACCAILLDAAASGNLNDDRRSDGSAAATIAAWTTA